MNGEPLKAAICSQLVVDAACRRANVAVQLAGTFLDGPQDVSICDEANDAARTLWEQLGGATALLQSIYWTRPLRPARLRAVVSPELSCAGAAGGRRRPAVVAGRRARGADAAQPRSSSRIPATPPADLRVDTVLAAAGRVRARLAARGITTIGRLSGCCSAPPSDCGDGALHKAVVRSGETIRGWYSTVSIATGCANLLQIAVKPSSVREVLDCLFYDAWQHGATSVTGRLEPRLLEALSGQAVLSSTAGVRGCSSTRNGASAARVSEWRRRSSPASTASGVSGSSPDRRPTCLECAVTALWTSAVSLIARLHRPGDVREMVDSVSTRVLRAASRPAARAARRPRTRFQSSSRSFGSRSTPTASGTRGAASARGERLYRVLVAGGSQPEGYLLDQDTSWPGAVHALARAAATSRHAGRASTVHVGSIARSGVGAEALDLLLAHVLPRYARLDAIVILVGASDVLRWLEEGAPSGAAASRVQISDVFQLSSRRAVRLDAEGAGALRGCSRGCGAAGCGRCRCTIAPAGGSLPRARDAGAAPGSSARRCPNRRR